MDTDGVSATKTKTERERKNSMRLVISDFETFWSQTHSLTKMSPIEYVMHPETEIISLAIKYGDEQTQVIFGEDLIRDHLEAQDWSDVMLVAHNMSAFDAMIFAWRFKVQPKVWGCTLAMARPIHSKTTGNSLAKLVEHYELGVKDNAALLNTKGRHLKDFTAEEIEAMRQYNCDDTDQCHGLFNILIKHYNAAELWQIDATIRMLVEPKFMLNKRVLDGALSDSRIQKQQALEAMGRILYGPTLVDVEEGVRSMLASAPQFAKLLTTLGVDVPMKASPSDPTKQIPALSKTDQEFLDLQEHEDPIVSLAASTRLDVKSTLLQTRLESFINTGNSLRGRLPIPLHYCGADTTGRWSGFMYNPQNLPRINPDKPKLSDALRKSMVAPPGYKVVVADLSGIELRVNHFLWKVPSSMALYQASPDKADLYKDFAAKLYEITEAEVIKTQRQVGKVAHLGLGFGSGAATFQKVAKLMGGVDLTLKESEQITYRWRDEYEEIVSGWKACEAALPYVLAGDKVYEVDPWGLVTTEKGALVLPSGRRIRYPALSVEKVGKHKEWEYGQGRHRTKIYSGKIDENIVQALARDVIAQNAYDVFKELKIRPSLMVHDELVYVVPEEDAQHVLDTVQRIMRTPPVWWPELITWSEGDIAQSYGEAK
jgi:DNA polymerase I-like protein with 3'-5' exonuclease and polymerase domains